MYAHDAMAQMRKPKLAGVGVPLDAGLYARTLDTGDLSAAVGVDVQTVRRWLRGESHPTGSHAISVLRALDAPPRLLDEPYLTRGEALALMVAHDAVRRTSRLP